MQSIEQSILENSQLKIPPKNDEIEVTLFGKGFGESCLVHIGDKKYILIDSFLNNDTKRPIALDYLDAININYDNIVLVICTHWHTDHINGISKIISSAPKAHFVTYDILGNDKFQKFLSLGKSVENSSTDEFVSTLELIRKNNIRLVTAKHNQLLYKVHENILTHKKKVEITALSPQHIETLEYIIHLNLPEPKDFKYVYPHDNDISIVTWIEINNDVILLGGDLENKSDSRKGWKAVVLNHSISNNKASIFKIPHHGSLNGHNQDVWKDLVATNPISILTVFNKCDLPTLLDRQRIKGLSSDVYVSGSAKTKDFSSKTLSDQIKKLGTKISIKKTTQNLGIIRLRKIIGTTSWKEELYGESEAV
ncbi:MAG: MBL fold metallo-hydrolase [Firmicutes bacterium]|nr:MBL fold metallo-hydrolase [Bacillota bacterium]